MKMKWPLKSSIVFLTAVLAVLLIMCSEQRDHLTEFIVEAHPSEWMTQSSTDFHGEKVAVMGLKYCAGCHGSDYRGGDSNVSCYTCHGGGPGGHREGWMLESSNNYHGEEVVEKGWESCARCHGEDYKGGTSNESCYTCHNGPSGHLHTWNTPSSENFHGRKVIEKGWEFCQACHGDDYQGGISGQSCYECHDGPSGHPSGWLDTDSPNFHGADIRNTGWNLNACQVCHGEDYGGGISGSSCNTCHAGTPEACNTCHGGDQNFAPPEDTRGYVETTSIGVGAHQSHLTEGSLRPEIACTECHVVPHSLDDEGHIDSDLPAEIKFGTLSTDNGALSPNWNGKNKCSNVYCHGEFTLGNRENDPEWTKVNMGQATCGSCHGLPPGSPHPQSNACYFCHDSVDQDGNLIDKEKHINGITDVR